MHSRTDTPIIIDLNELWEFRSTEQDASPARAQVPGCVHLDLYRNGTIPDPFFGTNELDLQWIEEKN